MLTLIDLDLTAKLMAPLVALLGLWITQTNRSKLECFFIHASDVMYGEGENRMRVHMHSYFVRNRGRKTATNVRLQHVKLPYYSLFPPRPNTVEQYDGGADIVIGSLVPGDFVIASYLYDSGTFYHQVNRRVISDEGIARQTEAAPQPMYPRWMIWSVQFLALVGATVLLYPILLRGLRWLVA